MAVLRPTLVLLALAVLLAGCSASNGPNGQSASAPGSLAYNGASAGTHSSSVHCDGTASVSYSANLGSGSLTVAVKDAAGATMYSMTTNGPGQAGDSKDATGAAGTWVLTATRSGQFSGQYALTVQC